jgi:hypothetical protein
LTAAAGEGEVLAVDCCGVLGVEPLVVLLVVGRSVAIGDCSRAV